MLSDMQLSLMRADVARMLPDTAIIQAPIRMSDGAGGWSETWQAVAGGTVACRLDPLSANNRAAVAVQQERETMTVSYQLTLPYDAPLVADRQVVVGGRTYQILQVSAEHSWNVSRRAVVAEVR